MTWLTWCGGILAGDHHAAHTVAFGAKMPVQLAICRTGTARCVLTIMLATSSTVWWARRIW